MIMEVNEESVMFCKDQTQMMIKGKRTKRQRPPTQLSLAMPEATSSRTTSTDNSGGFALSANSPATAGTSAEEEDQDMANCLILLAQGGRRAGKASSEHATGPCCYQCKTCNRCFSSFQALGGHRASHKKPNNKPNAEEKQTVTFLNEDNHHYDPTALSLQISAGRALYNVNNKSKVHECAICGAEFSSGQALGGHMRRHRTLVHTSATSASAGNGSLGQSSSEAKKPRNALKLDLNLPAPEDDLREPKFPFQRPKEKVIVFSASSLVDCHY